MVINPCSALPKLRRISGVSIPWSKELYNKCMRESVNTLREKEERQTLDVKNLEGEGRKVEVDNGITGNQDEKKGGFWTSDSETDSTPSPSENSFTSDTDVSSSSSFCSTGSSGDSDKRKGHNQYSATFELCFCQPCFAKSLFASSKDNFYPALS